MPASISFAHRCVPFCGLFAANLITFAATPPTPSQCVDIVEAAGRLACYDAAMGRLPTQASHEAVTTTVSAAIGKPVIEEPAPAKSNASLLSTVWELDPSTKSSTFVLRPYRPNYLLPIFYTAHPNDAPNSPSADHQSESLNIKHTEAKFQISLKTKAASGLFGDNGDIWLGYTQSSRWQILDGKDSRPFRETNYEPEGMLVFHTDYELLGWKAKMVSIGLNHQSNGRSLPLSRSWNRAIATVGLEKDDWTILVRPWWRIGETKTTDDNPDIADYAGRGSLTVIKRAGENLFTLTARHSLRSGDRSHGSTQFEWAFPIDGNLKGYVQVFDGYGESLIDYNHRSTYLGLGLSLFEGF